MKRKILKNEKDRKVWYEVPPMKLPVVSRNNRVENYECEIKDREAKLVENLNFRDQKRELSQ